jgi:hypothetical protein
VPFTFFTIFGLCHALVEYPVPEMVLVALPV